MKKRLKFCHIFTSIYLQSPIDEVAVQGEEEPVKVTTCYVSKVFS